MTVNELSSCIGKVKWCPVHLTPSHTPANWNMTNDPKYVCGVKNCKKHHHKSLHGATITFIAKVNSIDAINQHFHPKSTDPDSVIFAIQSIPSSAGNLNTLFGDSANCVLITKDAAKSLNLVGEPMQMKIRTAIGTKTVTSHTYKVPLMDKSNVQHVISAFEVESISENILKS